MELQNYINSHPTYISDFKKLGFKVNSFKQLKIISYPYDNPPDGSELWKMFLKGAVVSPNNLEKQVDAKPQAKVEPMPCKMPPVGSDTVFPRADNIFEHKESINF